MSTNPHSFQHISRASVQVKQTQGPGLSVAMVVIHRAGSVTTWHNQCTCAQADSKADSKLYFVSLAHSTRDCQHCCTVTTLPFASPAAFRQPDSLVAIRQLSQLSSAANCQLVCSLSAAQCQRSFTQPASNQ